MFATTLTMIFMGNINLKDEIGWSMVITYVIKILLTFVYFLKHKYHLLSSYICIFMNNVFLMLPRE